MPEVNLGKVVGPKGSDGAQGPAGADGLSAYEQAQAGGYSGSELEFNQQLAGLSDGPFVPESDKGVASGVATLDSTGKVPSGQLPSMDYIPTSQKGAASGVASLDATGKLEETQKPDYTASEVGAVPTARTVNGKALSADVTLTGDDIKTSATDNTPIGDVVSVLGGATTPQAALAALGAGVQDNDLINPFFEVNQRGVTEWTGGYGVDCWTILENKDTAKITVGSDGEITLTSTVSGTELGCVFSQFLERVPNPGEKYTLSFFGSILSGTVRLQLFNGTRSDFSKQKLLSPATDSIFEYTLEIPSTWEKTDKVRYTIYQTGPGVVKIKAAKKEPGDKQTLGYKDSDGAWHLFPQPESDYATQLAKCQRYLYALESFTMCPGGVEDDNLIFGIRFPVEMRIAPVFIGAEGGNNLQLYVEGSSGFYENQNFTLQWSSRTGATIKCQSPISLPPNSACNGRIDGKLMFRAEL